MEGNCELMNNTNNISEKLRNVKVVISDIEGTTTSVPFVRNTLKKYYLDHLSKYLHTHWKDDELQDILHKIKIEDDTGYKQSTENSNSESKDKTLDPKFTREEAEKYVRAKMDSNQLTDSLKLLQTKIWKEGYTSKELKGHLFPDVVPTFKQWIKDGKRIYVYSSGIKLAQKLLFTHSIEGNVLELISECFDTSIGSKIESESYKKILEKLKCLPEETVFLTDNVLEAEAALETGIIAIVIYRDGNAALDNKTKENFPIAYSFEEVNLNILDKKKKFPEETTDDFTKGKKSKIDDLGK